MEGYNEWANKHPNLAILVGFMVFYLFIGMATSALIKLAGLIGWFIVMVIAIIILNFLAYPGIEAKGYKHHWYFFLIAIIPLIGLIIFLCLPNKNNNT